MKEKPSYALHANKARIPESSSKVKNTMHVIKVTPTKIYITLKALISFAESLTVSIMVLFMQSRGLLFVDVGMVFTVTLGTLTFLNFPAGMLADRFGRKTSFLAGILLTALSGIVYVISFTFLAFLFAAFLEGTGGAFIKGALQAWIVDELKSSGQEHLTGDIFGKGLASYNLLTIPAGMLVFLMDNFVALYATKTAIYFLMFFVGVFFMKNNFGEKTATILRFPKKSLVYLKQTRELWLLVGMISILWLCYDVYFLTWQPIMVQSGLSGNLLGILYSVVSVLSAGIAICSGKLSSKVRAHFLLFSAFVSISFGFATMNQAFNILMVCFGLFLFSVGEAIFHPIYGRESNKHIPTEIRAATVSLLFTISGVIAMMGQPILGYVADVYGVKFVLLNGALIAIIGVILALLGLKR
jgi:MFS family permease